MQLKWGSYLFGVSAAAIVNRTVAIMSEWTGTPLRYHTEYDVTAYLDVTGSGATAQKAASVAEVKFRAAMATPYQNFTFSCDDGTASSMSLLNSDTMTGIRTKNVSSEETQGSEFTTVRTMKFTLEAEYLITNDVNAIVSYHESINVVGNGKAMRKWRFPINNAPGVRQVVTPYSLVTMTQSGEAVGHLRYPSPPPPQYPLLMVNEQVSDGSDNPKFMGQGFVNYPVKWSYKFERGDGLQFNAIPIIPASYL